MQDSKNIDELRSADPYIEISGSDESIVSENSVYSIYSARHDCVCGLLALLLYLVCMAAFISALYAAG